MSPPQSIVDHADLSSLQSSTKPHLPQSPGFTFGLEEAENVVLTDYRELLSVVCSFSLICLDLIRTGTLDVPDNATGGIIHEFDADLSNTSSGTCITNLPSASF